MSGRKAIPGYLPVILLLSLTGCVSGAIYHPGRILHRSPSDVRLAYEDVSLATHDGEQLSGWWIPAENARGTVLYCHGNGGNISSCIDSVLIINRLELNLLIFDYRGYGKSTGTPSEQGTYTDAETAWDYLVHEKKIAPGQVIIWGRSLGGPIAAKTASKHPPGLVIMESTFTSLKDVVEDRFSRKLSWLVAGHAYDTRLHLRSVSVPVLVIHSPEDRVVPFSHGKKLFDSLACPKSFLQIRGSHSLGFLESQPGYEASIREFIGLHISRPEGTMP